MNESELYAVDMAIGLVHEGYDIEDAVSQAVSNVWEANETGDEYEPYYEEPIDQEKVLRAVQRRFRVLVTSAVKEPYGPDSYVRQLEKYLGYTIQARPASASRYSPYVYTMVFPDETSAWNYRATVINAADRLGWYTDPYATVVRSARDVYTVTVEIPRFYTYEDMEQDSFWR